MIKANEARKIMEEEIARELQERELKAKNYCEEVLSKEIEKYATSKYKMLNIKVDKDIYNIVSEILEENGYNVKPLDTTSLTIMW